MKVQYDSTPKYFRYTARLLRPFPDVDFSFIKPIRKRAAGLLRLTQGNRVFEISEEVAANARNRIAKNGWRNAAVIAAPAESVKLSGVFDGLLMFGAPDAYASAPALLNVARCLKDRGRIEFLEANSQSICPVEC